MKTAETVQGKTNVHGHGTEVQGNDNEKIMNDASENQRKEQERLKKDHELGETDKKLKYPDANSKINDTAILKAIAEDSESVKTLVTLPADFRTAEYSTVMAFYYKRINANVVKLHDLLVKGL